MYNVCEWKWVIMNYKDIENSIIKKFRKTIWVRFVRAINEYNLIEPNDKIMVCISGGKDSMLLAKCFEELNRHGKFEFEVCYVVMNPGYKQENLDLLKENLEKLNIKAEIFNSDIFQVVEKIAQTEPCYMCARMRRGVLYNKARELGCNKIALGHHFDDVVETIMLNILYAGEYKTMMPKLKSVNFPSLELIRPFYYVHEEDIKAWAKHCDLRFLNCACSVTDGTIIHESKRQEIKELIKKLKLINNNVDINILRSSENVNLDSILGYKENGNKHLFLENYNDNGDIQN